MQRIVSKPLAGLALGALLIAIFLSIPLGAGSRALAQFEPTATPTDPLWRAFSAVRDAIQQEKSVDLRIVRSYTWEQAQWDGGIDACKTLENPADYRDVYWGWTFTITSLTGEVYQGRVSFDLKAVTVCDQVVTAQAPAPAAADPNLPTPVPGAAATGGFELGGHVLEMNANTVSLMRRAGMNWVKKQIQYNVGDDPAKALGNINAAKANGFKILLGIKGDKAQMGDFDNYINGFSQFVAGVAALGADAIEVWNEPNIDREWPAGQINGANYTRMLAAAYNAIKARAPNTMVISGAPAPTGFFGGACTGNGCDDDAFIRGMAAAGAAQFADCIGVHYNEGIVPPDATSGDPRGSSSHYTRYYPRMVNLYASVFPNKQLCFTELGYVSPEGFGPLPPGFEWGAGNTVQEQAEWLARAATLARQSGRIRLMIVWNVDSTNYGADPQAGYAIVRGNQCLACITLGAAMGVR